ncbi:hypothetical protein LWI29_030839 [Acer saccharum]|uniref:RNase H type-1 domain-containing protein n=1 Tax=Acer saccharum TaxID=4024 RepID=A0AA39SBP0_ACESA|nr:hypothetical protein LWI29_030839 [Acer saccharum]
MVGLSRFDVLFRLRDSVDRDNLSAISMILWGIWFDRNSLVHKKNHRSAQDILVWIFGLLKEYQDTQAAVHSFPVPMLVVQFLIGPPSPSTLKFNTDAAVFSGLSFIRIGAAIRDSEGKVLTALLKPFSGVFSVESAEVLALREGLVLAKQLGFQISWVEVDAANVADGQALWWFS